jgi:hypothetical protein
MVVVIVTLGVRGASGWSESFALFWYGAWAAAAVLAIVAIVAAAVRRNAQAKRRVLAASLGIATIAVSGLMVAWIIAVLSAET